MLVWITSEAERTHDRQDNLWKSLMWTLSRPNDFICVYGDFLDCIHACFCTDPMGSRGVSRCDHTVSVTI